METNEGNEAFTVTEILEKCVGCKWTMHVLAQIRAGVHRPGQLQRTADGLTTKVLNERLAKLTRLRIVERHAFPEVPPRVEYRLTAFGERFLRILDQIDALQEEFGFGVESEGASVAEQETSLRRRIGKHRPTPGSQEQSLRLQIIKATTVDINTISAILLEAASFVKTVGEPLWQCEELSTKAITAEVEAGLFYLAHVDGEPVGTFRFELEDPEFWPDVLPGSSAFLHRIAIKRKVAGKGVPDQMLDWAKGETKSIGREYLRLDCVTRPKLCALYERNGFAKRDERQVGMYYVARYEFGVRDKTKRENQCNQPES